HTSFSRDWSSDVSLPISFVLQSKTQDGKAGVWWVSPFATDQDVIIMVVRGWTQQKEANYPPLQPMTLTGTLRETQRGYFQPDNQIGRASCRERVASWMVA